MITQIDSRSVNYQEQIDQLLARSVQESEHVNARVKNILAQVKKHGDAALLDYTAKYDQRVLKCVEQLEVSQVQMQQALKSIDTVLRNALEVAAQRIRDYHEHQLQTDWYFAEEDGSEFGQRITALDRVGLYVPGGKASYPSSVLMAAIPARVAGVKQLIMTVPTKEHAINPGVLAAAAIAGVDRVFTIGGAQAIAALAYGTQTIPKVDKIVGPGNIYVATAKRMVFGLVGIDMIAGPSEVVVVSDETISADWVAMDLFAQAEHDEMAQSIHVTTSEVQHKAVQEAVQRLLPQAQRQAVIRESLANHGALILTHDQSALTQLINRIAPEHLQLMSENADQLLADIRHAGAIFIGPYSAESLGDYCAGPNHVLPTQGTARFSSPLGVYDFQKRSSIIRFSQAGARRAAGHAAVIAQAEGLYSHRDSALFRAK